MEQDIKSFINGIKEKTGLEIALFNSEGVGLTGNVGESETVNKNIDKIVADTVNGRTLFPINYKNKKYFGRIAGTGKTEQNYAMLISELAENYFVKEMELSRTEFYKAVLYGELNYIQLRINIGKFNIPERPCFVLSVFTENGKTDDIITLLENYNNDSLDFVVKSDDKSCAIVKFVNAENDEYCSSNEYAYYLYQSIMEETGIKTRISIGGTVKSIYDVNTSYNQAITAYRMSKSVSSKGQIHSFKEYMVIKMIEDLPKHKLNEYLSVLLDETSKEIFNDEDMINTAEEFLENSLNVSETSRKLFMHRNTLMYRLDKIERATGLNIRKFSDAVTFRLITAIVKLVK